MRTEPFELARQSVERQAIRLEWTKEFGQGVLDQAKNSQLYQVGTILGSIEKVTKDSLGPQLAANGFSDEEVSLMDWKSMRRNAKLLGLQTGMSKENLVQGIMDTPVSSLGIQQMKDLIGVAENLGGVKYQGVLDKVGRKTTVDPERAVEFFNDLKERLTRQSDDKLTDTLNRFKLEGGKEEDFQTVAKLAQGLPYGWLGKSMGAQSLKFASSLLGGLQTSLRAIPHLLQTPIQVPQLLEMKNFIGGLGDVLSDPHGAEDFLHAFVGIENSHMSREAEPGYSLENAGRVLRDAIGKGTLGEAAVNFSNKIAAQAGRRLAESWRANGLPDGAEARASTLGLNEGEIASLKEKTPSMSDETFRKIVQNAVGKTQFLADAPFNKGKIENLPLARMLFSYSSYMMGTSRANFGLIGDLKDAVAKGDAAATFDGVKRLSAVVAGSLGAGALEVMIKQAVKGQTPQRMDDSFWDRSLEALNQTALLGMTHRIADTFKFDGGVIERSAIGLIPKVAAVTQLMGALIGGYGKFGQFGVGTRLGDLAEKQIPVVGAMARWAENLANPRLVEYEEARSASKNFEKNVLGLKKDAGASAQLNPDYYPIFDSASKFDGEDAQSEATSYYKRAFADPANSNKSPARIVDDLRASLISKAPLNLNRLNLALMLSSLPADKGQKLLKAHMDYMRIVNSIAPAMNQER